MDRFIEFAYGFTYTSKMYLKSNMDRFIVAAWGALNSQIAHLKSSMDRFIVRKSYIKIILSKI